MRTWIIGILVLLAWTGGSSYWYVCKIKGLCFESGASGVIPEETLGNGLSDNGLPKDSSKTTVTERDTVLPKDAPRLTENDPIHAQIAEPFTILFAFAGPQTEGKAAMDSYLDALARYLKQNLTKKARLRGYTDDTAARENNLKLSQRRCDAIAALLMNKGVTADQIVTEPLGEADPVATNDTPAGRRLNRRVVISIQESP